MAMTAPTLAALTIGTGILGATTSYVQAQGQNRAARRAADSEKKSAQVQARQLDAQARLEQAKRLNQQEQIAGRVRVAAAQSVQLIGMPEARINLAQATIAAARRPMPHFTAVASRCFLSSFIVRFPCV